jgi:hypothetical protein
MARFTELTVLVDEVDDGDGEAEGVSREAGDPVKGFFRRRVEDAVMGEVEKPQVFIGRNGGGGHAFRVGRPLCTGSYGEEF